MTVEKYVPGSTSGGVLAKAHTRSTVDICTSSCVTVRTEPESERVTCVLKKTCQTRLISLKRDVYQWKETHKRDLYFSKETYLTYMRSAKVTYIKQRAKTWKRDLRTETIYSSNVYFTQKETHVSQKRPTKRPTSLKRDQYHLKETYVSQHSQNRQERPIPLKRDLYHTKETYISPRDPRKRPILLKQRAEHSTETHKINRNSQNRPIPLKRDLCHSNKEQNIQKRLTKEDYVIQKRPTKETYKRVLYH